MKTTRSLLIIDDSETDRAIYQRYLQQDPQQQYSLIEAALAQSGLALCRQQHFDAILLDFQLPDMNGLELVSRVGLEYPDTPVIMLTGHGDEQVAVSALKRGAHDYLSKDRLTKDILQRTVRNVIDQQQLRLQLRKTEQQRQLITQMGFQIRNSLDLSTILDDSVGSVRRLLKCDRVLAYQFAPDMSGQIIAESVGGEWRKTLGQTVEDTYFQKQGTDDYCHGRKQIVGNIYRAGLNACHIALLEEFQVKAILAVPVLISETSQSTNRLWGLIVAHQCDVAREWQSDEVKMLEALSVHCAIAIQHAELLAVTQAALAKEKSLTAFQAQIITTVSHEYNSPLTAIQGAADLLHAHEHRLDAATRENLLEIIRRKSKHMSALVNDMLLVHRLDFDVMKMQLTEIDLKRFVTRVITDQQITSDNHRLWLNTRGDLDGFFGDVGLIQQIFSNLLSNAIKYSPEGGDVKVYLIGDQHQIICSIKDQGIGISEKDQAQLFQSFSRGANVDAIPGTGLGLKIVKNAIDLHQGTIDIWSQEGQGTKIKLCLPKRLKS